MRSELSVTFLLLTLAERYNAAGARYLILSVHIISHYFRTFYKKRFFYEKHFFLRIIERYLHFLSQIAIMLIFRDNSLQAA